MGKNRIKEKRTTRYNKCDLLIYLIMIEVFTGGGGDFYSFNVMGVRFTARILFFLVLIGFYLFGHFGKIKYNIVSIPIYCICVYNLLSCLYGMMFNSADAAVSSYFSSLYLIAFLPMMSFYKGKVASYEVVYKTLLFCASIIATITLGIYISVNIGNTTVTDMRNTLDSMNGDWWMRTTGGVAYPSQTYILVAVILILTKTIFYHSSILEKILILYFVLAILSTSTRGLIITTFISAFIILLIALFRKRMNIKTFVIICVGIMIMSQFLQHMDLSRIYSFADQIDGRRVTFISEGLNKILSNPFYVIFGCGFGCVLPSTGSLNLEISLFEIFLEQGIIGVFLWLAYICVAIKYIKKGIRLKICSAHIGYGLIVSFIAIVILSFTNPYLNNTVGIICCFILLLIFEHECYEYKKREAL